VSLRFSSCIPVAALFLVAQVAGAADTQKEARVTRIIRDVEVLPSKARARPAVVNEKVNEGSAVRTGDESRSELTFVDLTITRLGANSLFSFNKAGRNVELSSGSILLRVPKDSGGAHMSTSAVTVGIAGTTVILESKRGHNKLTVLEGGARLSLNKHSAESVYVRGGQMEDVPAGATRLAPPVNVDLDHIMKTDPLITDFPPLPSRDLIYATKNTQSSPVYPGQPVDNGPPGPGPGFVPPILGGLLGAVPLIPHTVHTGGTRTSQTSNTRHTSDGQRPSHSQTSKGGKTGATETQATSTHVNTRGTTTHAHPSATPSRKGHKNPAGY
jgi:hypothetical protein